MIILKDYTKTRKKVIDFNPETLEVKEYVATNYNCLHKKYKDMIQKTPYKSFVDNGFNTILAIGNKLYKYNNRELIDLSKESTVMLVHHLKTKDKYMDYGWRNVRSKVASLVVDNNMLGTKEHQIDTNEHILMLRDYNLYRRVYKVNDCWSPDGYYLSFKNSQSYDIDYGVDDIVDLVNHNLVYLDENTKVKYAIPKSGTEKSDNYIENMNKALLEKFGERNGKPIFEVLTVKLNDFEGEELC